MAFGNLSKIPTPAKVIAILTAIALVGWGAKSAFLVKHPQSRPNFFAILTRLVCFFALHLQEAGKGGKVRSSDSCFFTEWMLK